MARFSRKQQIHDGRDIPEGGREPQDAEDIRFLGRHACSLPHCLLPLGIGLSLCQSIIQAHGGTISVSDHEPHGAAFEFILPRDEVNVDE